MNRVSVYSIISKVVRDLRLEDVSSHIENFIEWSFEAERHIGSFATWERKECSVEMRNKRAKLPCGLYKILQVKIGNKVLPVNNASFVLAKDNDCNSNMMTSHSQTDIHAQKFYIDEGFIHFSNGEDGSIVQIAWLGVPTDDKGLPYIKANHDEAVSAYIKYMYYYPDYIAGKLNANVHEKLERRWYWLCGSVRAEDNMLSEPELEAAHRIFNSLIPFTNEHLTQYFNT